MVQAAHQFHRCTGPCCGFAPADYAGHDASNDAGYDASNDAGNDATGNDASNDARYDASNDARYDASNDPGYDATATHVGATASIMLSMQTDERTLSLALLSLHDQTVELAGPRSVASDIEFLYRDSIVKSGIPSSRILIGEADDGLFSVVAADLPRLPGSHAETYRPSSWRPWFAASSRT